MIEDNITPQESIRLIKQIKEKSRKTLINKNIPFFLLWGYLTVIYSIVHLFTMHTTFGRWMWLSFPVVGYILASVMKSQISKKHPGKTFSGHASNTISLVIGITLAALILIPNTVINYTNVFPVVIIFIGMMTCIIGFIYNLSSFKYLSIIGLITAFVMISIGITSTFVNELIFAVVFFVMQCLPAHIEIALSNKKE